MNKELQNKAWTSLPNEFREEVKKIWSVEVDCATKYKSELHKHRTGLLYELFGEHLHWQHNLTSDTDGDVVTDTIDWEQRRYELAKELMKGFAANPHENVVDRSIDTLVGWSVCGADEIIKRLQEKNK